MLAAGFPRGRSLAFLVTGERKILRELGSDITDRVIPPGGHRSPESGSIRVW